MSSSLISIIIPLYNHASALTQCLLSIQKQTYQSFEVIIVNDGSTDNFEQVIDRFQTSDFGLRTVKVINQENKGAPAARNRGFKESKGEYVIFWDADTVAKPEMLEKMFKALQNNPSVSYAYSQFKFGWKKMKGNEFDLELLKKINYIDTTSLIRRNDFPNGGWDKNLKRFQDWDLWLTMLANKKTGVFVPEVLYRKIAGTRKGISKWLPSFAYNLFPNAQVVKKYNLAKKIVLDKHKNEI